MSKIIIATTAIALAFASASAWGADEYNTVPGLTAAGAPLGLHGVDPVALIQTGEVVEGSAEHTGVHESVAYYFASSANLRTFSANPERFAPQNGGFCTYGVSVGKKFDGDPRFAAVEDGRLYVFLNAEIREAFEQDRAGAIAEADRRWSQIRTTAAADL